MSYHNQRSLLRAIAGSGGASRVVLRAASGSSYVDQIKAQQAAASISTYGEQLFRQIFRVNPISIANTKPVSRLG